MLNKRESVVQNLSAILSDTKLIVHSETEFAMDYKQAF